MGDTTPYRFQLRRSAGWKKPPDGMAVGRPHQYGNPYIVGQPIPPGGLVPPADHRCALRGELLTAVAEARLDFPNAVRLFEYDLMAGPTRGIVTLTVAQVREELAGHPLGCSCPEKAACHAKVLIRVANGLHPTARVPFKEGPPWP